MFEKTPVEVPGGSEFQSLGASDQVEGKFDNPFPGYTKYFSQTGHRWLDLPFGEICVIDGFEEFSFASSLDMVSLQDEEEIRWSVTELSTGFNIPRSEEYSRMGAIKAAHDSLHKVGKQKLLECLSKARTIIATALAATSNSGSENSQSAERKASDHASTNQKDAGVHQTEEKS